MGRAAQLSLHTAPQATARQIVLQRKHSTGREAAAAPSGIHAAEHCVTLRARSQVSLPLLTQVVCKHRQHLRWRCVPHQFLQQEPGVPRSPTGLALRVCARPNGKGSTSLIINLRSTLDTRTECRQMQKINGTACSQPNTDCCHSKLAVITSRAGRESLFLRTQRHHLPHISLSPVTDTH